MANFGLQNPGALYERSGRRAAKGLQVVALASQKGGAGKTTLAGHLAVQALRMGNGPVALVDTDPQGSIAGWGRARQASEPVVFPATARQLPGVITRLHEEGYGLLFVDTPPAVTDAISEVVRLSDLVIVPTRPSPHDLRAVGATVDIVEEHERAMVFVVNSATRGARITAEAAVALSQHGTVAPVMIHHRVDYAASMIDGRTVMELSEDSRSAKEIVALWEYVAERLDRLRRESQARLEVLDEAETVEHVNTNGLIPAPRRFPRTFGRRVNDGLGT
jgi:chromosome partitioning protein